MTVGANLGHDFLFHGPVWLELKLSENFQFEPAFTAIKGQP